MKNKKIKKDVEKDLTAIDVRAFLTSMTLPFNGEVDSETVRRILHIARAQEEETTKLRIELGTASDGHYTTMNDALRKMRVLGDVIETVLKKPPYKRPKSRDQKELKEAALKVLFNCGLRSDR